MADNRDERQRRRGSVRQRGDSLQVRVFAGDDPVTGNPIYLTATIRGTDRAARKRADKKVTEFLSHVDKQRSAATAAPVRFVISEWMKTVEIEDSTRHTYTGYIDRTINPVFGDVPLNKVSTRMLESFYAELRRCRIRCDGKPFIEHRAKDEHDCTKKKCKPHQCKGMSASAVRQIHWIVSGALNAAVRWEWIASNPAAVARLPRQRPPEPDPPSPAEAARLIDAAFAMDDEWGTLVWLVMTTGMRRAEVCALRWSRVDLDAEVIDLRRSYIVRDGVGKEKDTKTHQMRRIALDSEAVALLRSQKQRVEERLAEFADELSGEHFVFTGVRSPDYSQPYSPAGVSSRYKDMATRLGIKTHLHALRHYSATELLTAGVDLRTVAGRLGHGGGGATTLRVYAAWVAATDRKAAEILGSRMPKRSVDR